LVNPVKVGGVVLIRTSDEGPGVDYEAGPEGWLGIDGSYFDFLDGQGNVVLHMSFRRKRNEVVLNYAGKEKRWDYSQEKKYVMKKFLRFDEGVKPYIGVRYVGKSEYNVLVNGKIAANWKSGFNGEVASIGYDYHGGSVKRAVFGHSVCVDQFMYPTATDEAVTMPKAKREAPVGAVTSGSVEQQLRDVERRLEEKMDRNHQELNKRMDTLENLLREFIMETRSDWGLL